MIELCFYAFSALLLAGAIGVVFFRNPVHAVLSLIFCFFNAAGLILLTGAEFIAVILLIVYVGAVAVLFLFVVMMMNITPQEQGALFSKNRMLLAFRDMGAFLIYDVLFLIAFCVFAGLVPAIEFLSAGMPLSLEGMHTFLDQSSWYILNSHAPIHKKVLVAVPSLFLAWLLARAFTQRSFLDILKNLVDSLFFVLVLALVFAGIFLSFALRFEPLEVAGEYTTAQQPPAELLTNTQALGQLIYGPYALLFQGCGLVLLVAMIGAIVLTYRKREGVKRQDITDQAMRDPKETVRMRKIPLGKGLADYE